MGGRFTLEGRPHREASSGTGCGQPALALPSAIGRTQGKHVVLVCFSCSLPSFLTLPSPSDLCWNVCSHPAHTPVSFFPKMLCPQVHFCAGESARGVHLGPRTAGVWQAFGRAPFSLNPCRVVSGPGGKYTILSQRAFSLCLASAALVSG